MSMAGLMMGRRVALALGLALWATGELRAQTQIQSPWPLGLDVSFVERSLNEFAAQGFARPKFVDLSLATPKAPTWVLSQAAASPRVALFSVVKSHGASSECWLALRPQMIPGSPELMLVQAGRASGASAPAMWRAMLRHEMAHCAIARLSTTGGAPDRFLAEPFADIFALDWSERSEPGTPGLGDQFARARTLASSGPHATSAEIRRWLGSPRAGSPCLSAWAVVPLDARPAAKACAKSPRRM